MLFHLARGERDGRRATGAAVRQDTAGLRVRGAHVRGGVQRLHVDARSERADHRGTDELGGWTTVRRPRGDAARGIELLAAGGETVGTVRANVRVEGIERTIKGGRREVRRHGRDEDGV